MDRKYNSLAMALVAVAAMVLIAFRPDTDFKTVESIGSTACCVCFLIAFFN